MAHNHGTLVQPEVGVAGARGAPSVIQREVECGARRVQQVASISDHSSTTQAQEACQGAATSDHSSSTQAANLEVTRHALDLGDP